MQLGSFVTISLLFNFVLFLSLIYIPSIKEFIKQNQIKKVRFHPFLFSLLSYTKYSRMSSLLCTLPFPLHACIQIGIHRPSLFLLKLPNCGVNLIVYQFSLYFWTSGLLLILWIYKYFDISGILSTLTLQFRLFVVVSSGQTLRNSFPGPKGKAICNAVRK